MNHRAEYLLQVLEKIGAPLMTSIITVNARSAGAAPIHNEAQKIAELLAKTVQASIDMSHSLDLGPTGTMTDSIRIALAGLAGPLVAQSFSNSAKAPGDAEIRRMVAALQAVLSFAENFEANSENAGRLKEIAATGQPVDTPQGYIQYIQAFLPVLGAVSAFSFGQPEQKLVLDISSRLTARAEEIRKRSFGELNADNKRAELGILKALADIYAVAHIAETARIQSLNDDARAALQSGGAISMDTLWKNFETQTAMMEALALGIAKGKKSADSSSASGGSQAPAPPPVQQAAPPSPPPPYKPAEAPASSSPLSNFRKPGDDAPPPRQAASGGGNPMAFFKNPPKDD